MTAPIKNCPQPDPPELVMRADGYHYQSEDEMQDTQRELTDEQIDDLGFTARIHLAAPGTGKQAEAARTLVRAAIAAHVALNAADRDVMRPTVTDEMVAAYLTANDKYWREKDALPSSQVKWRNGTPSEATRISLEAALAASPTPPAEPQCVTYVDGGALKMALSVLRRAGKNEVADALEATAVRLTPAEQQAEQEPVAWINSSALLTFSIDRKRYPAGGAGDLSTARYMRSDHHNTPLYTHPAPSLAELRAKVEALEDMTDHPYGKMIKASDVLAEIDKLGGKV